MPTYFQLPYSQSAVVDLSGNVRRKQILKTGAIRYEGKRIDFTPEMFADLAAAFDARAYDQVPFQLATDKNEHNLDPRNFAGDILALVPTATGLDAIFNLSADGCALVDENPGLGVSCRLVTDYDRADGESFPIALQHVLGTLDPRITGMAPWAAVDLATTGDVVDLTAASYEGESTVPELTDDEVAAIRATLAKIDEKAAADKAAADKADPAKAKAKTEPAKPAEDPDAMTADEEAELARMLAEDDAALAGAALSNEAQKQIDLARSETAEVKGYISAIFDELNATKRNAAAAEYTAAGVPPALVDLCAPFLDGQAHTVDLSNTETADVADTMRQVLDFCKGMVDLSGEHPAAVRPSARTVESSDDTLARIRAAFPQKGA